MNLIWFAFSINKRINEKYCFQRNINGKVIKNVKILVRFWENLKHKKSYLEKFTSVYIKLLKSFK